MAKIEQVRARDKDRVAACALLDSALADGQLSAAEHTARTRSAMRAKFTGDLAGLVRDLQVPENLADAEILGGRPRRSRWWPVAVLAAAVVIGAAAGLMRSPEPVAGGPAAVAEAEEAELAALPDLTTGSGLALFIDRYRAEFGDSVIDTATVYPDKVLVQRVQADGPALYLFDAKGFREMSTTVPSHSNGRPIDLGEIDVASLAALLAGAPASVQLPGGSVNHVSIGYELIAPVDAGPTIGIYADGATGGSGKLTVSMSGQPLSISTGLG